MATIDPYASCPCGSGKKFKWCCQEIHEDVVKAFRLEEQGQHEAALRALNEVVAAHASNPEVYGRLAQLLYMQEKFEESEAALQKAFAINDKYPFGLYLQGRFRHQEGEIAGALILFRKAARYYDPAATLLLSDIYGMIFDCELNLNHPIAARAALALACHLNPGNDAMGKALDQFSGEQSGLPESGRKQYTYLPQPASATPTQKQAWQQALGAATGKLDDAAAAFQKLTEQEPDIAPAWFNLGLTLAWLGQNGAALDALDRFVSLETDETRAAQAWTIGEVLRCGQGMEDHADVVENIAAFQLQTGDAFGNTLNKLHQENRLVGAQASEDGRTLHGLVLEKLPPALMPELAKKQNPHLGAALLLVGNFLTLRNTDRTALDKILAEFREAIGNTGRALDMVRGPARFSDLFSEVMVFPLGAADQPEAESRIRSHFESYYEEAWLQRPLKSLGGVTPLDAQGSPVLRKKLAGLVNFYEECAALNKFPYDWNRLRRKLGLLGGAAAATATAGTAPDIASLGTAELAGLDVASLNDEQLELAFQSAQKLDARDLAGKFAESILSRPARADRPDRYLWANHLIQLAVAAGNFDRAIELVDQGEKDDCEHNEGRRRNDYELRRAQLLCKRGSYDEAQDAFERLIARVPSELRYQSSAAESLVSARQGKRAIAFAEKGLANARQQNNRDMEGFFQELLEAAKRQ